MHLIADENYTIRENYSGVMRIPVAAAAEANMDHMTIEGLDEGLFRALRRLGSSKERMCSALCLSYAEYDDISKLI